MRVQRSTWLRTGDVVNFGAARLRVSAAATTITCDRSRRRQQPATSPRRRSSPRAPVCKARAKAKPNASMRSAFAPPRGATAPARISFNPTAHRARRRRDRRRCRAVVHFHRDLGQRADRSGGGEGRDQGHDARGSLRRSRAAAPGRLPDPREQPGYSPAQLKANVTACAESAVRAQARESCRDACASMCRAGARVTVDGKELGNAPGEFELAAGQSHDRYRRGSAISRSPPTSRSRAQARRRRSRRSSCRTGPT